MRPCTSSYFFRPPLVMCLFLLCIVGTYQQKSVLTPQTITLCTLALSNTSAMFVLMKASYVFLCISSGHDFPSSSAGSSRAISSRSSQLADPRAIDPSRPHLRTSWLGEGDAASSSSGWPCWVTMTGARMERKRAMRSWILGRGMAVHVGAKTFCMSMTSSAVRGGVMISMLFSYPKGVYVHLSLLLKGSDDVAAQRDSLILFSERWSS